MATTSSSATRGSTMNISSYVRMGARSASLRSGRSRFARNREEWMAESAAAARRIWNDRFYTLAGRTQALGPIDLVHGHLDSLAQPGLAGVGGAEDHLVDRLPLLRGEGGEHEVGQPLLPFRPPPLRPGAPPPEPQARPLRRAQVLEDRLHAAVAARAAAPPQAQAAERQVDLVEDCQDLLRLEAVALHQAAGGIAATVHIGLRQGEQGRDYSLHTLDRSDRADERVALHRLQADAVPPRQLEHGAEADVVAGVAIALAGVAETQDEPAQGLALLVGLALLDDLGLRLVALEERLGAGGDRLGLDPRVRERDDHPVRLLEEDDARRQRQRAGLHVLPDAERRDVELEMLGDVARQAFDLDLAVHEVEDSRLHLDAV